jgi:hypothetical protein
MTPATGCEFKDPSCNWCVERPCQPASEPLQAVWGVDVRGSEGPKRRDKTGFTLTGSCQIG